MEHQEWPEVGTIRPGAQIVPAPVWSHDSTGACVPDLVAQRIVHRCARRSQSVSIQAFAAILSLAEGPAIILAFLASRR